MIVVEIQKIDNIIDNYFEIIIFGRTAESVNTCFWLRDSHNNGILKITVFCQDIMR